MPLFLKLPGSARAGARVDRPVGLVDVFPTVTAMVGIERPSGLRGASLLGSVPAPVAAPRAIYAETLFPRYHFGWSDLASLTNDRYQYIHGPRPELFGIMRRSAGKDGPRRRFAAAISGPAGGDCSAAAAAPGSWRVGSGTIEKLAALGYIGVASPAESAENLPAPRDHIQELRMLRNAVLLCSARRYEEGIAALHEVIEAEP